MPSRSQPANPTSTQAKSAFRSLFLVIWGSAVLGSCGPTPSRYGSHSTLRLLDSEVGTWQVESAWFDQTLPTGRPEQGLPPAFAAEFESAPPGTLPAPWIGVTDPRLIDRRNVNQGASNGSAVGEAPTVQVVSGMPVLAFAEAFGAACLSLEAAPLSHYVLRLKVRMPEERRAEPLLALTELRRKAFPPGLTESLLITELYEDPARTFTGDPIYVGAPPQKLTRGGLTLSPLDAQGFEEWRFEFHTGFQTHSLLVGLIGCTPVSKVSGQGLEIGAFAFYEVPLRASLNSGVESPALPDVRGNLDAARRITKVRRDGESRRALLLTPGSKARCHFVAPHLPARLELALCLVPEMRLLREGPTEQVVELEVRQGRGGPLCDQRRLVLSFQAEEPHLWHKVVIELGRGSQSEDVEWELHVRLAGQDHPAAGLVALGSPLLLMPPRAPPVNAPVAATRNVILVSLDTLRADRLGRRIDGRPLTPYLDQLAAESTRFTQAVAPAAYTLPSHVSLFTSLEVRKHRVLFVGSRLRPGTATLAELLAGRGYLTAAFTAGGMLNPDFCAIDAGFDQFGEIDPLLSDTDQLPLSVPLQGAEWQPYNRRVFARHRFDEKVCTWIREHADLPFFLFLHTYLVHNYQPDRALMQETTLQRLQDQSRLGPVNPAKVAGLNPADPAQFSARQDLPVLERLYDLTVQQADQAIGRLRATLAELGLEDRTILIVTSDHGEEFLEHDRLCHGRTFYDEMIRVPLVVHVPGQEPALREDLVSLIDVAPTLLSTLGVERPAGFQGRNLLGPAAPGRITLHAGVKTRQHRLQAARSSRLKLIHGARTDPAAQSSDLSPSERLKLEVLGYVDEPSSLPGSAADTFELYDVRTDPGENHNLWPLPEADDSPLGRELRRLQQALKGTR